MTAFRPLAFALLATLAALAPPCANAQARRDAGADAAVAPHAVAPQAWSSLDPAQQEILAPLRPRWDSLSPRKQAHLLERARHWSTLPPPRREEIRERIAHWQHMTPAQREEARANRRKFRQLPPEQRARLHAAFEHFQQLPPAQRERLIRQWHSQTIEQRLRGLDRQPPGHQRSPGPAPDHRPQVPPGG